MYVLDAETDVRDLAPRGAGVGLDGTGRERRHHAVVKAHKVRCGGRDLTPVQCGVATRDGRPGVCVGGRFAGEVPGVEFFESGIEVVEVEPDARRNSFVSVDLDDAKRFGVERVRPLVAPREANASEGETLAAQRNGGRGIPLHPGGGTCPYVCDLDIASLSETGVHHMTTVVNRNGVGC